ncbi:MAG: hypothetical protein PHH37_00195 [Paludibacter sp.]|nr:hypothetical protein [Paludibacter sp.]
MSTKGCESCPMRAKFDKNPKSLIGRFWRWHINFCPGWREYFGSLSETDRQEISTKYQLGRSK